MLQLKLDEVFAGRDDTTFESGGVLILKLLHGVGGDALRLAHAALEGDFGLTELGEELQTR